MKPEVRGGLSFAADNNSLLYPAGCGIAVFDTRVRTKRYIYSIKHAMTNKERVKRFAIFLMHIRNVLRTHYCQDWKVPLAFC